MSAPHELLSHTPKGWHQNKRSWVTATWDVGPFVAEGLMPHCISKPLYNLQLYSRLVRQKASSQPGKPGETSLTASWKDRELSGKWPIAVPHEPLMFQEDRKVFCQDSDQLQHKPRFCGLCRYVQGRQALAWSYSLHSVGPPKSKSGCPEDHDALSFLF